MIREYLEKGSGKSSMRLGFIISVYTSCFGGILLAMLDIIFNKGANLFGVAAVIASLQAFAFGGKTLSGKYECKKDGEA